VERYSRSVFGGPKQATLPARGDDLDLWSLIELLRTPVTISADEGDAVWWGYVAEVTGVAKNLLKPTAPRVQFGVSLNSMRNRIALAYTLLNAAGEETRVTTAWDDAEGNDLVSQMEYGIWELLWTASASSQAHAEAARAMKLSQVKYPVPTLSLNYDAQESQATLICRGWWDTLDWRYCSVPLRLALAYTGGGLVTFYAFGNDDILRVAQSIQITTTVNLAAIMIKAGKSGAPDDSLEVNLYTAVDDEPDTEIVGASIDAGDIAASPDWLSVSIATTELTPGTYFLVMERSGSQDPDNYYWASPDLQAGYTPGFYLAENDSNEWISPGVGDLPFQLYADEPVETTQQIASLARNYGQFLREIAVDDASGITVESFRDGDSTALYEMLQMLQMGTDNQRRLLADIDLTRRLRIYEEPAPDALPHLLYSDGSIADATNIPVRKPLCPVGMWARWTDVIPPSVNTTQLADPSLVFIDENEYDVANDRLNPIARGYLDPWDYAKVKDG
jgi:hypothetical protein